VFLKVGLRVVRAFCVGGCEFVVFPCSYPSHESAGKEGKHETGAFSEDQIIAILKEAEVGAKPPLCPARDLGRNVYTWRSKYGVMEATEMGLLRQLEDENRRLVADQELDIRALKGQVRRLVA